MRNARQARSNYPRWRLKTLSLAMLAVLVLSTMATACQAPPAIEPAPAEQTEAPLEPVSLKVASLPFIAFAPFFIAQEEGYFQEQGLEVELVNLVQGQDALTALISGEVDVSAGLLSAGILNPIARGTNLRVVADKGYIDPQGCDNIAMIARSTLVEPGQAVNADLLRGRTIEVVEASWNEYFLAKGLDTIGLTLDDVTRIHIPVPSHQEALEQEAVDAVTNNEPWVSRMKKAGHQPILTPITRLLPNSQSAITLYGPSLLDGDPDAGNRFMLAYLKAVQQYNEGKTDRNLEIMAKYLNLDAELLKEMCWPSFRGDGQVNVESVLDFQRWLVERGLLDEALPADQIVDMRFVEHAADVMGMSSP